MSCAAFLVAVSLILAVSPAARAAEVPETSTPSAVDLRDHPVVQDIRIQGLDTVATDTVLRVLETREGEPFDAQTFRRDLEGVAALGYFDVLRVSANYEVVPGGIRILLHLVENPRIGEISLLGNVKFTDKKLRSELPVKEGDILQSRAESDIRKTLRSLYGEAGYSQVRVSVRRIPAEEPGRVNLAIHIDEGERLRIDDLIIEGNDSYPDWWIAPRLVNHGSWLLFSNYYDDALFQDDLETVRSFYVDRGFLDVQVRAGMPRPGDDKGEINPVIVVEEGERYRVSDIRVAGNTLFLEPEVREPFLPLIGDIYSGDRLRQGIEKLRELYGNEGYIDLVVHVNLETDPPEHQVAVDLRLEEGEPVYVGQPKVDLKIYEPGTDMNFIERFFNWMSPPTKEETILREVRLEPGKKYRRYQEVRTLERLRRLKIFEKVNIRREATDDPQVRNPVVEAEESANAGYIAAAVGYGDVTGAAITLSYVNPNIAGEAKVLRASATFGENTTRYLISFLNRHWRGSDTSLELSAYRNEDRFDAYEQRIYGTSAEFGHPLTEYLTGRLRLRLEDVRFRDRAEDREEELDPYQTIAVRPLLDWDHRDDIQWPTRGFRVVGGFETGYADGAMLKFLHSFEYYKRLYGGLIWAYQHDLGMMPYDHDSIGITERFFLGGGSDLRGFDARGASPVDAGADDLRVGGATKFAQRNELRFPIVGALKGRMFVDDGFIDKKPWNFLHPRMSTGFGFLVNLKIVNLEVDLARALVYEDTDSRRLVHFRISSGY